MFTASSGLAERDLFTTRPTRETPRAGATPELRDVMAKRREERGGDADGDMEVFNGFPQFDT